MFDGVRFIFGNSYKEIWFVKEKINEKIEWIQDTALTLLGIIKKKEN